MSRLIDADVLLEYLQILPIDLGYREVEEIEEFVKGMPTIEERKKGEWIKISPAGIYECSVCGQNVMTQDIEAYHFCHGCGADMRQGEGENE